MMAEEGKGQGQGTSKSSSITPFERELIKGIIDEIVQEVISSETSSVAGGGGGGSGSQSRPKKVVKVEVTNKKRTDNNVKVKEEGVEVIFDSGPAPEPPEVVFESAPPPPEQVEVIFESVPAPEQVEVIYEKIPEQVEVEVVDEIPGIPMPKQVRTRSKRIREMNGIPGSPSKLLSASMSQGKLDGLTSDKKERFRLLSYDTAARLVFKNGDDFQVEFNARMGWLQGKFISENIEVKFCTYRGLTFQYYSKPNTSKFPKLVKYTIPFGHIQALTYTMIEHELGDHCVFSIRFPSETILNQIIFRKNPKVMKYGESQYHYETYHESRYITFVHQCKSDDYKRILSEFRFENECEGRTENLKKWIQENLDRQKIISSSTKVLRSGTVRGCRNGAHTEPEVITVDPDPVPSLAEEVSRLPRKRRRTTASESETIDIDITVKEEAQSPQKSKPTPMEEVVAVDVDSTINDEMTQSESEPSSIMEESMETSENNTDDNLVSSEPQMNDKDETLPLNGEENENSEECSSQASASPSSMSISNGHGPSNSIDIVGNIFQGKQIFYLEVMHNPLVKVPISNDTLPIQGAVRFKCEESVLLEGVTVHGISHFPSADEYNYSISIQVTNQDSEKIYQGIEEVPFSTICGDAIEISFKQPVPIVARRIHKVKCTFNKIRTGGFILSENRETGKQTASCLSLVDYNINGVYKEEFLNFEVLRCTFIQPISKLMYSLSKSIQEDNKNESTDNQSLIS